MKKSVKKVISMFTCIAVVGGMLLMGCGQTSVPDKIADSSEKKESSVEPEKNGEEPALQKVTLNEVAHSIFYAPMYVAIEEGYFKDVGIDLDLVTGFGADKVMTAVLSPEKLTLGLWDRRQPCTRPMRAAKIRSSILHS